MHNQKKTVHVPFDGRGKNPSEAAELIASILINAKENFVEEMRIIIPAQWGWGAANFLHPSGGLMNVLKKDNKVSDEYRLVCFANSSEAGLMATRI